MHGSDSMCLKKKFPFGVDSEMNFIFEINLRTTIYIIFPISHNIERRQKNLFI